MGMRKLIQYSCIKSFFILFDPFMHTKRIKSISESCSFLSVLNQHCEIFSHRKLKNSIPSMSYYLHYCWILTLILNRSLMPTLMANVEPGRRGKHTHSPYWWARLRSRQHGTNAPIRPAQKRGEMLWNVGWDQSRNSEHQSLSAIT